MTDFSRGINKHRQIMQNRSLPLALELTGNASNPSRALALFERAISAGVDRHGDRLSSVMPSWEMYERDFHDIA
jgi:hypothetical protein